MPSSSPAAPSRRLRNHSIAVLRPRRQHDRQPDSQSNAAQQNRRAAALLPHLPAPEQADTCFTTGSQVVRVSKSHSQLTAATAIAP